MSKTQEEEYDLSDSQRIAVLEGYVSTNRNMLIVMVLLALVGISVAVTVVILKFTQPKIVYVQDKDFALLEQKVEALEKGLTGWQGDIGDINRVLDSSSATAFKAQMLAQEKSYQLHLKALKQGMRDLARMLPGSRTWLDIYNEKMDLALKQSKDRQNELTELQTSRLPSTDARPLR